ncbi:MAG TPA: DUF4032 domain-containing protein [Acidimicrobiia bacterium]|nr:DUF4032 domain-containing protein [Acidimicrobiia bacterium]
MSTPNLTVRAGHPDFLELPWETSLEDWAIPELVDLPKGISRHVVRFVSLPEGIYAIKELNERAARHEYAILRELEELAAPAVSAVGLVTGRTADRHDERSAALITAYESFSFSYRELLEGPGFGKNRSRMLNAFAFLLVRLHLLGVFWGDCSLSNVLYRWDADSLETIMVDAETASIHPSGLSDGQRREDLSIMIENVAGGVSDVAAMAGTEPASEDLAMGLEIAERYESLWSELADEETMGPDERYRIGEKMARINALGFDVEEVELVPATSDGEEFRFKLKLGGRTFHSNRLRDLTGVEALENQARVILSDLYYFQAREGIQETPTKKDVSAIRWRVTEFEPMIERLRAIEGVSDPIQAYCDLLHHRYLMATELQRDVSTEEAFEHWVAVGRPGYPPPP